MAANKRTSIELEAMDDLRAERLRYKTPKERARINSNVPVEQRMLIVEQRKKYEDTERFAQIQPKFSEESRTCSIVSSLAFFFGSPVGAELTASGDIEYKETPGGMIRWRIDDFFKGRDVSDVMTSICDAVLGTDDDDLLHRVYEQIKSSDALSDRKKKSASRFFDKLFKFRMANRARRNEQIRSELLSKIQFLPEDERILFLQGLGVCSQGPVKATNVAGNV